MKNFEFARDFLGTFGALDLARYALGLATQTAGFLALLAFLPARRPSFRALLAGAAATTVLFELLQFVNLSLTRRSLADTSATEIYGTIPLIAVIFFVWIRLIWMCLLIGACVCRATSRLIDRELANSSGVATDLFRCARLFEDALLAFEANEAPEPIESLASARGLSNAQTDRVLGWLVDARLVFVQPGARATLVMPTPKGLRVRSSPRAFLHEIMNVGAPDAIALPEALPSGDSSPAPREFATRVLLLLKTDQL